MSLSLRESEGRDLVWVSEEEKGQECGGKERVPFLFAWAPVFDWLSLPTRWWPIGHGSLPMQK